MSAPPAPRSEQPRVTEEPGFSIPTGYGDDRIVLMVKDPWWLFAYWEVQPGTERAARAQLLPQEVAGLHSVLRVHDVTDVDYPAQPSHRWFDIGLSGLATNWYIQTDAPGRSFIVELGLLTNSGRFLLLVRSNRVTAPRFGPSDIIDEAWLTTDEMYWKLFGGDIGMGASGQGSAQLVLQRALLGQWSSGNLYGFNKPPAIRGFWCRINTDVIIHGATEPKATVTVQGERALVRKDGTFSIRLALPEGTQTIVIEVTSADGRKIRTVSPVISLGWAGTLGAESNAPKPTFTQQRPGGSS